MGKRSFNWKELSLVGSLSLGLIFSSCSKSSDPTTSSSSSSIPTALSTITGDVTATTGYVSRSLGKRILKGVKGKALKTAVDCTTGTWSMAYIGEGGDEVSSGSVTDGQFTIEDIPVGKEAVITFSCDGGELRCFGKSGDFLTCNLVADGVVGAFESVLGVLITDTSFAGKTISKVASAIVEASKNDTSASDAFKLAINSCKSNSADEDTLKTCYKEAIQASPFAGTFKMLQALAGNWTIEGLFTLLADTLGFQLAIDSFIYSEFATQMDTWFDTDFVAETRSFLEDIVADQLAGGDSYVVKVECRMWFSKYRSGGQFKYEPVIVTVDGFDQPSCKNDAALEANGLSNANITAIYSAIDSGNYNQIQLGGVACNTPNGWDNASYFCASIPSLMITSKYVEPNRNDLTGEKRSDNNERRLDMIMLFDEAKESMMTVFQDAPDGCITGQMEQDGPPPINTSDASCVSYFQSAFAPMKKYFSGMMGLYMYLTNPSDYTTGGTTKLSLNDIHTIFTHEDFLSTKLTSWAPGYSGTSIQVDMGEESHNTWVPPVMAYDSDSGLYTMQEIFRWDNVGSATADEVRAAIANSTLPYTQTFSMFENIPTSDEIQSFVFGSSHHEEWNPYGSKYFWAPAGNTYSLPIFCKMTDVTSGKPVEKELSDQVLISCLNETDTDSQVTIGDETGEYNVPDDFDYPYVLVQRGWQGDDKGRIFALADRRTGEPIRPGEKEVMILELSAGNGDSCTANGDAGELTTASIRWGWGEDASEQSFKVWCMDFTDYAQVGVYSIYWGGEIELTMKNGDGSTFSWKNGQAGARKVGDNTNSVLPICYFAPTSHFTTDANGQVSLDGGDGGVIDGSGEITNTGTAIVDYCNETHANTSTYNIIMMGGSWGEGAFADLAAYLYDSQNGKILQFQNWSNATPNYESLLISIKVPLMESEIAEAQGSGTYYVAPHAAPSWLPNIQVLNQKHNAKFDPYCDDVTGPEGTPNGKCDCYEAGTTTFKDPDQCSLEDDAAEPTLSQLPYCSNCNNSQDYEEFFADFGGKSGAELVDDQDDPLNGQYLNDNQLWMPIEEVFQCKYLVDGETTYRKPTAIPWNDFTQNSPVCPDSNGVLDDVVGGAMRIINPKPMKNAYDIERPNRMVNLINYATKTIGQGVTVDPTEKLFSFDEALSFIALRYAFPPENFHVYEPGTTTASDEAEIKGAFPFYQPVRTGDRWIDEASAVLRGLIAPDEL